MLTELRVRDLGVIRDLTLDLRPGMTVLTGETGAGKTLLVEALQLVTGGRASAQMVRAGAMEALVEARFEPADPRPGPSAGANAEAEAKAVELDPEPGSGTGPEPGTERLVARTVAPGGRSKAWVDGRMAPVAALAEHGTALVELLGQHEHQALTTPGAQRRALDHFAGIDLAPLAAARLAVADTERRLAALGGDDRQRARQADVLRHQVAEIDAAGIGGPDEDEALRADETRLADLEAHRLAGVAALTALEGPDAAGLSPSALGALGDAVGALGGRDPFGPWESRLRALMVEASDVAAELRREVEGWDDDPERLAEVQARRRRLADLRRKYGDTLADVLAYADEARDGLSALAAQAAEAEALDAQREDAGQALLAAEEHVRRARQAAAPRLGAAVTERLADLAMGGARFEVTVGRDGAGDAVQFLLAANPGEPAQPLARVASGGELSRTMLALRLVTGGGAPTAIFDEVDAGVGGAAALALAKALHEVSGDRQVLVVTHLAQVAALADHHIAVRKAVDADGRTTTVAEPLDTAARVVELSRMLSGHPDSATARAHAEELLELRRPGGRPRALERSTTAGRTSE